MTIIIQGKEKTSVIGKVQQLRLCKETMWMLVMTFQMLMAYIVVFTMLQLLQTPK